MPEGMFNGKKNEEEKGKLEKKCLLEQINKKCQKTKEHN